MPDLGTGNRDYEYFLKDHLGNTRVSMGTKTETLNFSATMEAANATEEETYFKNLPEPATRMPFIITHREAVMPPGSMAPKAALPARPLP